MMQYRNSALSLLYVTSNVANGFVPTLESLPPAIRESSLFVAIGLGPGADEDQIQKTVGEAEDIPEPDHELFRDSRLSDFDKQCDAWYASLLTGDSFLGPVSEEASRRIKTLVKLERQPVYEIGEDNWTPYQQNILPGSPILPSFGLEQYGLPIPRKNAEAWRQFDVPGLVGTDYSSDPSEIGKELVLDKAQVETYEGILKLKGAWIDDEKCSGRLVYINGRYTPSLSYSTEIAKNLSEKDFASGNLSEEIIQNMNRLTDGFTDRLAADVPSGETEFLTSQKTLSGPNHHVGDANSQFSINNQAGTACFVALNSVKAGAVALVSVPSSEGYSENQPKPVVLVVNAITADGGLQADSKQAGSASHPRSLVMTEENTRLSFVQSFIDLDDANDARAKPKLVNGCTQIFVGAGSNVTHTYLQETGGIVTGGVELTEKDVEEGAEVPRDIESKRKSLLDTHFESIDVQLIGDDGRYECGVMGLGGTGRSRISISTSLLRPRTHASVNGLMLAGGAQRTDMRTNIHHIAQGTTSRQGQKNMIGGRATGLFKGRIRVEQSAQQTDSEQLARSILLSDKSKAWATPSLEIIADDVMCTHGATVSDLSEEELFYLRSRGIDRTTARNILMYAFVDDVASYIEPEMCGDKDDPFSLKNRVIRRLQNLVPQGEKELVGGEFQSV